MWPPRLSIPPVRHWPWVIVPSLAGYASAPSVLRAQRLKTLQRADPTRPSGTQPLHGLQMSFRADWSCQTTRCGTALTRQAWASVRRGICEWQGEHVAVYMLAKPLIAQNSGPFGAMRWTRSVSWLEALRGSEDGVGNCSAWEAPPLGSNRSLASEIRAFSTSKLPSLLLADLQVYHLRPEGANAAHFKQLTCALFALVRLMTTIKATRSQPRQGSTLLLNFGSEWASWSFLGALDHLLRSCSINPAATMLLHINPGAMLSLEDAYAQSHWGVLRRWAKHYLRPLVVKPPADAPQVRQAYWPQYFHELLRDQDTNSATQHYLRRYRLCAGAGARGALLARMVTRASGVATPRDNFLLLGGQARSDRGLVFLELSRLDLLRRARWSAGRFAFCSVANESLAERFAAAGPFEAIEASELLGNAVNGAPLVRKLCTQLPKVLDVDPTNRAGSMPQAKHSLWQDVNFALVFETSIPSGANILREHLLFATEKPLRPIQALRPFVMLGTVGSLALLRALGFRTDFGGLNASYDRRLWSSRRVHTAIQQVQHLLQLPPDGLRRTLDDALHNQAHLMCGGLQRELRRHALYAWATAVGMARGIGDNGS